MARIRSEELEFYLDMAAHECQRWLECTTRERFIDDTDFLYSIRYGSQLRQIANRLIVDCLPLRQDDDWVLEFLAICHDRLSFKCNELCRPEDLDPSQFCNSSDSATVSSLSTRLRRVCVLIGRLAEEFVKLEPSNRFDQSALEPLSDYHLWLVRTRKELPIDYSNHHLQYRIEYKNKSTMNECEGMSMDLSDSCSKSSSISTSPLPNQQTFIEGHFPTRLAKTSPVVSHNPLQFIQAKTNSLALAEQAKQQISLAEEQKKLRSEALQITQEEEENKWLTNLDEWRCKRKMAFLQKRQPSEREIGTKCGHQQRSNTLISPILDDPTDSGIDRESSSCEQSSASVSPQGKQRYLCRLKSDMTSIYRDTDASKAAYQPVNDTIQPSNVILLTMESDDRTFGFSISGGKEKRSSVVVDGLFPGGVADRKGVRPGDRIISVNGENVQDKYLASVNRMIHESLRLGEIELSIRKDDPSKYTEERTISPLSTASFDEKRNLFCREKQVDSYYEFRQNHPRPVEHKWESRAMMNPASGLNLIVASIQSNAANLDEGLDYRVSSLDERRQPGKLADFIPEVERAAAEAQGDEQFGLRRKEIEADCAHKVSNGPKLLRNYDLSLLRTDGEILHENKVFPTDSNNTSDRQSENQQSLIDPINDSKERLNLIEQQRLPSPGLASNKLSANKKFRLVTSVPAKDLMRRRLPPVGLVETTRVSKLHNNEDENTELRYMRMAASGERSGTGEHWLTETDEPIRQQMNGKETNETGEEMVSVSGKHLCSHCRSELGRGAAMIIESLNLFYHLSCFRCYVCNLALGNGIEGADVRVKDAKLHCHSCYSNDEVGLKFSEV